MPLKPWVQNISPLAWCLGASAIANVITTLAVLYLAFGIPRVFVRDGFIDAYVRNSVEINDRSPIRVQVAPR